MYIRDAFQTAKVTGKLIRPESWRGTGCAIRVGLQEKLKHIGGRRLTYLDYMGHWEALTREDLAKEPRI